MPQPVALVAVADQQFALALEQAGAVDFDGFDRGRPFGGVVRAVGRVVRVRLEGEHRSTPSIRAINANASHLPGTGFSARPRQARTEEVSGGIVGCSTVVVRWWP